MPRLIRVFPGHTVILLVLSWGGSSVKECEPVTTWPTCCQELSYSKIMCARRRPRSAYIYAKSDQSSWHPIGSQWSNASCVLVPKSELLQVNLIIVTTCLLISYVYRKFPKYLDIKKIWSNHSKIWPTWLYHRVMSPNDADGMASSLIWVCTVCPGVSARKLGIITVHTYLPIAPIQEIVYK